MEIYNQLADELYEKSKSMVNGSQFWIGLAGAPGSGKSTLANLLKTRLKELFITIPLDGYHYYRNELGQMKIPLKHIFEEDHLLLLILKSFIVILLKHANLGQEFFPVLIIT